MSAPLPPSHAAPRAGIRITIGTEEFAARLETSLAPVTCAGFLALLPLRARLVQGRWSGEAAWVPLDEVTLQPGAENLMHEPRPGQLLFYPAAESGTEILVPYGLTAFAAKCGPLSGNHFMTIAEGLERLEKVGEQVWWEGARDIVFERTEI